MATTSRKSKRGRTPSRTKGGTRKSAARRSGNDAKDNAIALLKADHREVEGMFEQFEKARSDDRKLELAQKICTALTTHAAIEEEIFYPAFLKATDEKEIHHEAEVEHAGAKNLIAQIEEAGPDDDHYDAKVTVLSEMIKHHVKEEEKPGGMFAKARQSAMDLKEIGRELLGRKQELMAEDMGRPRARVGMGAPLPGRGKRAQQEAPRRH